MLKLLQLQTFMHIEQTKSFCGFSASSRHFGHAVNFTNDSVFH